MRWILLRCGLAATLFTALPALADTPVRLGVITDMSGPYVDLVGPGFVTAVEMAVEDFGGKVLGRPIEVLSADDQTKPDIATAKAREWYDTQGVVALFEGSNSASAVALQRLGMERKKVTVLLSGSSALTNQDCSPYGVQYAWDTYSLANGTATALTKSGFDSWFFITADYTFGKAMEADASAAVEREGGRVVGEVRHPINSADFSSFALAAQSSEAKVVAFANAGRDTQNAVRQSVEFGIKERQKLVPLLVFDTDIKAMGLELAQGMMFTTAYYWDYDDQTREFAKRFFERHKSMPTMNQAGVYSAALHYLKAVERSGTLESDAVIAEMKKAKVDDFFGRGGYIRDDGRMVHEMYLVEVKTPNASKQTWDIASVKQVIPGEDAFAPLEKSTCPFIKK